MDYLEDLKKELHEEFMERLAKDDGLQEYRDKLLKAGFDEDKAIEWVCSEFSRISGAGYAKEAISNYLENNDKETLIKVVENSSKAFKYKAFRIFVADVLRRSDVRGSQSYKRLSTIKKEEEILNLIRFCKKLGYPLKSDYTVMSCFALTAKKMNVSQDYVKEVYKSRNRSTSLLDQKIPEEIQKLFDTCFWGNILKMNDGRPSDWESFEGLYYQLHGDLSFRDVINYKKTEGGTI